MERVAGPAAGGSAGRGGFAATALLGLGAAVAYLLLRRLTAHGNDVFTMMRWLDDGVAHPQHPLYLVLARGVRTVLAPFGVGTMAALAVFSAVGAAVGVAAVHRAALVLGAERVRAAWLAATVASLPTVVFFATVGELQAPFFGGAGLAAWAVAVWLRQDGSGARLAAAAAVAGIATACAALQHATGHLLVPVAASACWWGGVRRPAGERLVAVAVFAGVHAGLAFCGFQVLQLTGTRLPGDPGSFLAERADVAQWIGFVPSAFVAQWLVPFAPLSVLAWLGLRRAPGRMAWFLGVATAYLLVSTALARAADEVGGYLLPLAFPAAYLAVDVLPRRALALVFALAVAATASDRLLRPQLAPDFALADAVATAPRPTVWLVGDEAESWGARWYTPGVELVEPWVAMALFARSDGKSVEALDAGTLAAWLEFAAAPALAAHKDLVVTAHAVTVLGARLPTFATAWQTFTAAHRTEPVAQGTRVW